MFLCLDEYGLLVRKTAINHIRVVSESRADIQTEAVTQVNELQFHLDASDNCKLVALPFPTKGEAMGAFHDTMERLLDD